jgi:hypothetical protein
VNVIDISELEDFIDDELWLMTKSYGPKGKPYELTDGIKRVQRDCPGVPEHVIAKKLRSKLDEAYQEYCSDPEIADCDPAVELFSL